MGENKPKVIVIPAAPKNTGTAEQRQLRVAAYCRVSTKEEDQLNSYEAQKNYYTDKIMENKSWTMADIFADEGITGTSAKKRADFMRMMKWCKQGKIDLILTKSVSRFARNTVDCLNYVRMLKAQGIAVYFEKENINSMDESTELMLTMMGAFAQRRASPSPAISRRASATPCSAVRLPLTTTTCTPMRKGRMVNRESFQNRPKW